MYNCPTCQDHHQIISSIFSHRPNVISENGSILMNTAAFVLVELMMPGNMSLLTVCLIHLQRIQQWWPGASSTHYGWIAARREWFVLSLGLKYVKGVILQSNFFVICMFFLLFITQHPYLFFNSSHEVTDRYLLVLGPHVIFFFYLWHPIGLHSPLTISITIVRLPLCSMIFCLGNP